MPTTRHTRARPTILRLSVPRDYHFVSSITTYGYYVLAPNQWDAATASLHRPLRRADGGVVNCTMNWDAPRRQVVVRTDQQLARPDQQLITRAVRRMLRLDEDLTGWFKVMPSARRGGLGRLFRSPDLFEDVVKTITSCNVAWSSTVRMNELLCAHYGEGGFPTPGQLAPVSAAELKTTCRVGYRAERIVRLARQVADGTLDLVQLDNPQHDSAWLLERFRALHGIGPYAAHNLLQHVGRYDALAIDSETYRHFRERYGVPTPRDSAGLRRLHARIEQHYAPYAPYQFLAYWRELWNGYVNAK